MAAIPRTPVMPGSADLTLQRQLGMVNDPLSTNIEDRRNSSYTILDSILDDMRGPLVQANPFASMGEESNPLLDQLITAERSGALDRDTEMLAAAIRRSPWRRK